MARTSMSRRWQYNALSDPRAPWCVGLLTAIALSLTTLAAAEYPSFNIQELGHVPLAPAYSTTDVWVDGQYIYVGRGPFGCTVIDATDPYQPVVADHFNPGPGALVVNDVKTAGHHAYLSNESANGLALAILDVTDPYDVQPAGGILAPELTQVHNLYADGTTLYVTGHSFDLGWRTFIYDVADPTAPEQISHLAAHSCHDVYVEDGILYESAGWEGLHIWDVSDPTQPVHLAAADQNQGARPHYHTHNAWPSADGRYVFTTNEIISHAPGQIAAGGLKVWRWDGASSLEWVTEWRPNVALGNAHVTIHNVQVVGSLAYVSYYQAGLRVLDVSDPENPVEVGAFDTYPEPAAQLFEGCWGVDAHPSGRVVVSDRSSGVHILEYTGLNAVGIEVAGTPAVGPPTLGRAEPNPFRWQTQMILDSPTALDVRIFDIHGRRVRTLPVTGSAQRVVWDGRTDAQRRAAAGVYFFALPNGVCQRVVLLPN